MPEPPRVYRVLTLHGTPELLDIASAFLDDHDCLGTEELDSGLRAYFEQTTEVVSIASALSNRWPGLCSVVSEPVPDRDWWLEWKRGLRGFPLGSRYFILPTWCEPVDTERLVLRIDPERAFGTGTHETTLLEVELIEAVVEPDASVIDLGTGTGILAMVAASEGAAPVRAIEPDPDACECARRNIVRNGFAGTISVERGGWQDYPELASDFIIANINASTLQHAVSRLHGTLLLSGILTEAVESFTHALPRGAEVVTTRSSGEWSALVVTR